MKGRKPKPTAVKILEGNPGRRKLNAQEPKPRQALPACPPHLKGEARLEWRRTGRKLVRLGVMTDIDKAALAAYCVSYGRWADAEAKINETGTVLKTAQGNLIQNPHLSVANRAMEQMCKLASEFGMTPVSRTRVHADQADKEMSLAEMLFEGVNDGRGG